MIQAILVAGITPNETNTRAITQTSRQLRYAALSYNDLWVNLSTSWRQEQFEVWINRLQGRPVHCMSFLP